MRLRLVLAGLLLLLAACGGGDGRAPFIESRIPPALSPRFWAPEGWAWGLIKVGDAPAQRYGVATTAIAPKAQILVLTGYGESAETWFETVRDLNGKGYTVWVLERAGQGGSERYVLPRDLGHAPTFNNDIAATKALTRMMAAGSPDTPLIILGHSVGGLVAVAALEKGAGADGLILSAPAFAAGGAMNGSRAWLVRVGLGRVPARWDGGWKRDGPDGRGQGLTSAPLRGAVQKAWQLTNPDLRMGGQSLGWLASFETSSRDITPGLAQLRMPALLLAGTRDSHADAAAQARVCAAMVNCVLQRFENGRHALHQERDDIRTPWLTAVEDFVRQRIEARKAAVSAASPHEL
ncbi:MAG: alpha/beta hydrolase [Caulobacter sp.]|nr:alpha/beta hydrolase [Caulobacter sp.]